MRRKSYLPVSIALQIDSPADHHRPSDTADKINYGDLDRVAGLAAGIARRIGELDWAPVFTKVEEKMITRKHYADSSRSREARNKVFAADL